MPAGSPAVRAMRGLVLVFKTVFDVGAVAQLAQPVLVGFFGLASLDFLTRLQARGLTAHVLAAALDYLDQVPAEGGLGRLADLAGLEFVHGFFEFRHGVTRTHPAEVAALGGGAVFRVLAGEFLEMKLMTPIDTWTSVLDINMHSTKTVHFGDGNVSRVISAKRPV